ncbi:methylated-DNA--[protein]-cysteine S-methyltransferase [Microbacterium ulmi]|uniref:Methylated-DNA--protein-cysteine methyltransferase n=1 Tax=Microbacterium ulmi TaxID=179095 RepID=A0A7Y2M010_9MICO|nr:methylated-DNA--[protein]-cysteine S-methyltransferase [Microbacterium ulmi]NII68908.1 methylated-DNA-[protein]-cysteine S-methyltransferase [Microbacterium ulmi]NNH03892.1 methylated-DNA--[protein]-cysteine S-methyltransferase [Microbacterium ulmi]
MTARHAYAMTSLGELMFVTDGEALTGVYFPAHRYPPAPSAIGERVAEGEHPVLAQAAREVREYLADERAAFDVPVRTAGDEFSERVWALLREIPHGETTTYGTLAERLGARGLAQRVGQAVGHNPVSIVIPCHRVVGADGSLTGFAGGLDRKRALLELEEPAEVAAARLF